MRLISAELIAAYSVWLMPLISDDLVGYNNSNRNKCHLFCSGHGPQRRKTIAFAEQLITEQVPINGSYSTKRGCYVYRWICESADDSRIFLILNERYELVREEINLIRNSLEMLAESLRRGLDYEDLFDRASNDPLTGLANRRVFDERIQGMIDSTRRYKNPLSMISIDLDRFKNINDNAGHQRGDEVLKAVATVLKRAVRSTDLLVRMGGDEFVIVLDNTDLKNGRFLAERLCIAVDELGIRVDDTNILGISIGMSELKAGESLRQWMERTDDILYHAKAQGRSRVAIE